MSAPAAYHARDARQHVDGNGVRRKDTTKGPPLRILSLDGGGVRGYSMLIIVQEIMHRCYVETHGTAPRRSQIPKPCDYFDLIVGTGTGGLIALMLGRLRLDLETCKELYVRMTRLVFETDKTIAGIPYRSTLFKASKLEAAIKEAVREHTVEESEGNDGTATDLRNPLNPQSPSPRRLQSNASTVSFSARSQQTQHSQAWSSSGQWGDPDARLYDSREKRTKTAILAMYKGAGKTTYPMVLRSYDSRREPPPEFDCKIWEAGRATCSIGLAFKPIQIGQSVFHDDGAGPFNPSPEALDEAVLNEWPGREIGVFVSVGTGKRPRGTDSNQQMWYEGFMGEFAEARRRLVAKIEACEATHEKMMLELLPRRNVNVENYYRFNVEIGVGEFGMNEWHRLADISSGTRQYLRREEEQAMIQGATTKLAKIYKAHERLARIPPVPELAKSSSTSLEPTFAVELPGDVPSPDTKALPPLPMTRTPPDHQRSPSRQSYDSGTDNLPTGSPVSPSPRSSIDRYGGGRSGGHSPPPPPSTASTTHTQNHYNYHNHNNHNNHRAAQPSVSSSLVSALTVADANGQDPDRLLAAGPGGYAHNHRAGQPSVSSSIVSALTVADANDQDPDRLLGTAPTPSQYRNAAGADKIAIMSPDEHPRWPLTQQVQDGLSQHPQHPQEGHPPHSFQRIPPPLPPKTPLPEHPSGVAPLRIPPRSDSTAPYPLDDEPPPVNMARKPDYRGR